MAQNQDGNEASHIRKLVQDLRRLRINRNAVRALGSTHLLEIPIPLTDEFYNALREKIEINNDDTNPEFVFPVQQYKSPRDLAIILVDKENATKAIVQKLFEKQYELEWHTLTGDPDQFSFYGFCKDIVEARANANATGEEVVTYNTRRAHVISRLYHAQQQLLEIRRLTFEELCPPVYVCTRTPVDETWTKWKWDGGEFKVTPETNVDISWISKVQLRKYIRKNSKSNYSGSLPNQDDHLYWAVLEEDDFDNDCTEGENGPFKTQVYVGKASKGIKNRWVTDSKSHCKRMKFARDVMCGMVNYDPTALQSEQLVDLRFLLHKACNKNGENSGLFIMRYDGDLGNEEKNNIDGKNILSENWKPKDMNYGMNYAR